MENVFLQLQYSGVADHYFRQFRCLYFLHDARRVVFLVPKPIAVSNPVEVCPHDLSPHFSQYSALHALLAQDAHPGVHIVDVLVEIFHYLGPLDIASQLEEGLQRWESIGHPHVVEFLETVIAGSLDVERI